jgi:hypothetical protein
VIGLITPSEIQRAMVLLGVIRAHRAALDG